jgi:hypothetical protein
MAHVTFITTTSYGSWLPGDCRGYVQDGRVLPPTPALERHAASLRRHPTVRFSEREQTDIVDGLLLACDEFDYQLSDLTVESWHLHWIVRHLDSVKAMIGRLKNRMRRRLNRGRIWTDGYCHRRLTSDAELLVARNYIRQHPGCRIIDGQLVSSRRRGVGDGSRD